MATPLVTIDDVSLFLPGDARQKTILHHIRWQVEQGGHCGIVGPNGSGKTTLLRLTNGHLWADTGSIVWHTDEGEESSPIAGRGVTALVSPDLQAEYQRQAWDISGHELMLTGIEDTPLPYTDDDSMNGQIEALAARLAATELLARSVPTLSQGQLRILLLARALLRQPALLLLDECLDGLDVKHKRLFLEALEEYAQTGTVVMSAHRDAEFPGFCRERRYMLHGRLHGRKPAGIEPPDTKPAKTLAATHAPDRVAHASQTATTDQPPLLSLENVSVYIDRHKILHKIDWQLRQGEHWRISGENGSGKSTLLRLLAGDELADSDSTIRQWLPREGREASILEDRRKSIHLVSDLSQSLYAFDLTGLELVCSGYDNSIGLYRDFSRAEKAHAREIMRRFLPDEDLRHLASTPISRLSTGQLRRLFLARALVGQADILLLDEPCSGLDAPARTQYLAMLDQLAVSGLGLHLVFVTHYDEDLPRCITHEARMADGRLTIIR